MNNINKIALTFYFLLVTPLALASGDSLETLPPEFAQNEGVEKINEIHQINQSIAEKNEILLLKCASDARPTENFNFYLLTNSDQKIIGLRLKTFEKSSGKLISKYDYNPDDLDDKVSLSWKDVGFFRVHINWIEKAPNADFDLNHGGKLRLVVTSSHSGLSIYRKILPIEVIHQGSQWSLFSNTNAGRFPTSSIFFQARYEEYNSNGEGKGEIIGIKELRIGNSSGNEQIINLDNLQDH